MYSWKRSNEYSSLFVNNRGFIELYVEEVREFREFYLICNVIDNVCAHIL